MTIIRLHKKPTEYQALEWKGDNRQEIIDWIGWTDLSYAFIKPDDNSQSLVLILSRGRADGTREMYAMEVFPNYFIIRRENATTGVREYNFAPALDGYEEVTT